MTSEVMTEREALSRIDMLARELEVLEERLVLANIWCDVLVDMSDREEVQRIMQRTTN